MKMSSAAAVSPLVDDSNVGDGFRGAFGSDEIVDIPDTGPSRPCWEDPALVDPLLVIGDGRERQLVEQLLLVRHRIFANLDQMKSCDESHDAAVPLGSVRSLIKALNGACKNIVALRPEGIQTMLKLVVPGAKVGLGAKIQEWRQPANGSPEAFLVERVEDVEDALKDLVAEFLRRAHVVLRPSHAYEDERGEDAGRKVEPGAGLISGGTAPLEESDQSERHLQVENAWLVERFSAGSDTETTRDRQSAARWRALSDSVLAVVPSVAETAIKLRRGGRQVVIVEERRALPDEIEAQDIDLIDHKSRHRAA